MLNKKHAVPTASSIRTGSQFDGTRGGLTKAIVKWVGWAVGGVFVIIVLLIITLLILDKYATGRFERRKVWFEKQELRKDAQVTSLQISGSYGGGHLKLVADNIALAEFNAILRSGTLYKGAYHGTGYDAIMILQDGEEISCFINIVEDQAILEIIAPSDSDDARLALDISQNPTPALCKMLAILQKDSTERSPLSHAPASAK